MRWLFIEPGRIGDWILSQHVVTRFARENDISISWAVRRQVLPLLPLGPSCRNAIGLPSPMSSWRAFNLALHLLTQRNQYDVCVVLSPALTGRFAIHWLRVGARFGYIGPAFECVSHTGTTTTYNPEIHHLMGRALMPFYPDDADKPYSYYQHDPSFHPKLSIPENWHAEVEKVMSPLNMPDKDFILICPGAKWPGRLWDNAQWVRLAEELAASGPVLFATDPQCEPLNQLLTHSALPENVHILPPLPLNNWVSIMARAQAVVSLDSGPMHMAAALGVPCIALYGPSNVQLTGALVPLERIAYIHGKLDCQPCITPAIEPPRSACIRPGSNELRDCMASISLQEVVNQVKRLSYPYITPT